MMGEREVTAVEMARAAGVDPKRFRQKLREARLAWHAHNAPWRVVEHGPRHEQMVAVLTRMLRAS
ncbi:hypothetical protein AS593_05155 [Caulobacter vibrioides]|nr:hypothetical protein AS593_05155 [Caulobacter vibrioides]